MSLLVRHETASSYDEGPPVADRPRAWGRGRVAIAVVLVLTAGWAMLPLTVDVGQDVDPGLPVDAGLLVPEYGATGAYGLHYRHHDAVTLTVPLRNEGPLPLRVSDAGLDVGRFPLLVQTGDNLPLTIGPWSDGDLELTFRFDNCRYYHERSAATWDRVLVEGSTLGRRFEEEVRFAYPVVLHGQVILDCPDRTLRRDDDHPLGR